LDEKTMPTDPEYFASTHWSVVLAARKGDSSSAAAALEILCETYWYPVYAYVRGRGFQPEDAQDITQGFFARFLGKKYLSAVQPERGKFRWFLLCTVKRFLVNEWLKNHTIKRGGRIRFLSIEEPSAEARYRGDMSDTMTPEKLFDRAWAMRVLEAAHEQVQAECRAEGKAQLFEQLKVFLSGDKVGTTYAEVGARMNMTNTAVKVAVHRLRGRYRQALRAQIAHTVTTAAEIDEEIRDLFAVFNN
jgi:RNA polymerase sigma-70 factor (ECF subfamily)